MLTGAGTWTKLGLGITGEVWNNALAGKSFNSAPYTNARTYPIMISIYFTLNNYGSTAILYVDGMNIAYVRYDNTTGRLAQTFTAIVPAGKTYYVSTDGTSTTLNYWAELY